MWCGGCLDLIIAPLYGLLARPIIGGYIIWTGIDRAKQGWAELVILAHRVLDTSFLGYTI